MKSPENEPEAAVKLITSGALPNRKEAPYPFHRGFQPVFVNTKMRSIFSHLDKVNN
jgi:hypothetical protein